MFGISYVLPNIFTNQGKKNTCRHLLVGVLQSVEMEGLVPNAPYISVSNYCKF